MNGLRPDLVPSVTHEIVLTSTSHCKISGTGYSAVTSACQITPLTTPNRAVRGSADGCPDWTRALNIDWLQKKLGSARIRGLGGAALSIAIGTAAIFALTHSLRNIDYENVFAIIWATDASVVALALIMVTASYASITLYDWLALHTMGRSDVPYRIAALASFTSYPIAHCIGAVALISPVIRYHMYAGNGLGAIGVANVCFITGLTFWLGNMTALGLSITVAFCGIF